MPHNAKDDAVAPMNDSIYKRLLKERIIWLDTQVAEENASAIYTQMPLPAAEDPDSDICLYINSPGGSVTTGMTIYDTMQYIKPGVVTVTMGVAASMRQLLLTAEAKGKHFATPHARILIRQPLGRAQSTASEVRINADLILTMKNELTQVTAECTGHTLEEITRDADRSRWYTVQEVLEYGFTNAVAESIEAVKKGE